MINVLELFDVLGNFIFYVACKKQLDEQFMDLFMYISNGKKIIINANSIILTTSQLTDHFQKLTADTCFWNKQIRRND